MQHHKTKVAYNVPEWVKEQWKTKDQNYLAQLLMDANWSKDPMGSEMLWESRVQRFFPIPYIMIIWCSYPYTYQCFLSVKFLSHMSFWSPIPPTGGVHLPAGDCGHQKEGNDHSGWRDLGIGKGDERGLEVVPAPQLEISKHTFIYTFFLVTY